MKIHHFQKRAPRSKDEPRGRDGGRRTLELEHPTLPEMSLEEPPEEVEDEAEEEVEEEPVRSSGSARPEMASRGKSRAGSAAAEADERGSRKSRGGSMSRRAADDEEEEEPPPGSVAERLNTSRRLISEGRFGEARVILERLVTLGVASGPVHTELGAIYMAQGSIERALERFEDALHLEPMDLFARVCRGEARLGRGDLRLAREDLQRVLDMGTAGSPLVERAQQLLQRAKEQGDRKRQ
ncbi:MAG: tetratricopeptide repeat protein [Hyalangium sp.]|uniref:tetratricopeptide repeat protein n=1 Tax=Hyalangium sp. TaxID=2028555 RepID=UPI00389999FA